MLSTKLWGRVRYRFAFASSLKLSPQQSFNIFFWLFDLNARSSNQRKILQDERIASGKNPYKEGTLKQKASNLDIVESLGMWKQLGQCLYAMEMEELAMIDL